MSTPEEQIIDLIEDPYRFFSLQMEAIKAVVSQAYHAGFLCSQDIGGTITSNQHSFEEWWSGEELSE